MSISEMKKGYYVEEIKRFLPQEGRGIFFVSRKEVSRTRSGDSFIKVFLRDKTGEIEGRIWDDVDRISSLFSENDFVDISFERSTYNDRLQLRVISLKKLSIDEVDEKWFIRESKKSVEWMRKKLLEIIESIKNPYLRELLELIFSNEEFTEKFFKSPASLSIHHAYLGGLAEHTLSVTLLLDVISKHYRGVNRDLLIASGILHDIGKVFELSGGISPDYTDTGRLLGHIYLGARFVDDFIGKIDGFPQDLRDVLIHTLLSHHGEYEYGSPKRPKTIEALILHYVDNMDAKVSGVRESMESEEGLKKGWTDYHRVFGRRFYYFGDGSEEED